MIKTRDQIQKEIVDLKCKNIFVEWVTGLGKTLAALKVVKENEGRWLFIYKETTHLNNHLLDVQKHKLSELLHRIDWTTYDSIHKYNTKEYKGIILDECHAATSPLRQSKLSNFKDCKVIALSATIDRNVKEILTNIFGSFHTHKVTFDQAHEWGILPKPKVILIPLKLDNTVNSEVITITKGKNGREVITTFKDRFKYLKEKNINLIINCTEQEKYDYITNLMDYYKQQYFKIQEDFAKNRWLQQGTIRKRYLASLKEKVAKSILKRIENKNYICFAGSIEQALELGGQNVVYSNNKENTNIIRKFNNGIISNIFAVNMLKEGINLNNIEASLIIQLGSKELDIIQRIGRILRAKESPIQYIIYFKNTQDEVYLENVLNLFETEII